MEEQDVVSKVEDLMQTLDQVKKYNELARSLRTFAIIVVGSMALYVVLRIAFVFLNPSSVTFAVEVIFFVVSVLVPFGGLVAGVLYVRRKVNSVRMGKWREELSEGFPAALKLLSELDWERTFDEISVGKLSYALYGLLKAGACWLVVFVFLEAAGEVFFVRVLHRVLPFEGFAWGLLALLVVLLLLGDDLVRRYKEVHALDLLLWELRWFSLEFRRAEFKA